MRVLAVVALLSVSCAAHNSHRIPIDLNADLAPLIDEAWARMEEASHRSVARGGVPVAVAVEPVEVQWLPFSPEVPPGSEVIAQAALVGYIEDAVRPKIELAGAEAQGRVSVEFLVDLHEPDALQIQVECELFDSAGHALASGRSIIVRFPRLYCHGCRDRLYGHGTRLQPHDGVQGDGYVETGGFFLFSWPSSSAGYHKN